MFAQDEAAREAYERREAHHAVMKRALENAQPIATLYDLDKARTAASSAGALSKRAAVADDEEAEYYADGTLRRVRQGTIEKTYYPNGTLKRVRLLDESELAGAR